MMREVFRERHSQTVAKDKGNFSEFHSGGRDFRENLVSVFIGNLNPCVDSVGLWGIFKVFGKVRDVFHSTKKEPNFAFIRFETLAEAEKVAQRVNGMHVYGWPIVAKVASYDWKNRRSANRERMGGDFLAAAPYRGKVNTSGNVIKETMKYTTPQEGRTYADVARNNKQVKEVTSRRFNMSWSGSEVDEEWLSTTAVGVLKNFGNLEKVNRKLEDRGINFSSAYMGGKQIAWSFDSSCDRDGFVSNSFFWRDCFSSMDIWREQTRMAAVNNITWIDVFGVPLSCWCNKFFKKIGGKVGEVLWIDEKTESKRRLDYGRILVLAPLDKQLTYEVSVNIGNRTFPVSLREQQIPVTDEWINNVLGLKQGFSNLNEGTDKEWFDKLSPMSGKRDSNDEEDRSVRNSEDMREKGMGKNGDRMGGGKEDRQLVSSPKMVWKEVGGKRLVIHKGKGLQEHRQKIRYRRSNVGGAVKIDKKKNALSESSSDDSVSSGMVFKMDFGPDPNQIFQRGECSNRKSELRSIVRRPDSGNQANEGPMGNKKLINKGEMIRPSGASRELTDSGGDCNGPNSFSVENRSGHLDAVHKEIDATPSIQMVPETQGTNNKGIEIIVDLTNRDKQRENYSQQYVHSTADCSSENDEADQRKSSNSRGV
ncbi:hypothetical protein Q3G72_010727 [Acer saccharum]|nr:hypothetical protein Q3G72_010727 [Acer saccharum]